MVYPLHELKPGERAEIVWVISGTAYVAAAGRAGFYSPGTGDLYSEGRRGRMSAYQIQDTVIALRPQNAREVLVRPLQPV